MTDRYDPAKVSAIARRAAAAEAQVAALTSERDSLLAALKDIQKWADEAINNGGVVVMTRRCEDISDEARAALTTKEG